MPQGVVLPVQPPSLSTFAMSAGMMDGNANEAQEGSHNLDAPLLYYIGYNSEKENKLDLLNINTIIIVSDTGGVKFNKGDLVEFIFTGERRVRTNTAKVIRKIPTPLFHFIKLKVLVPAALLASLIFALILKNKENK